MQTNFSPQQLLDPAVSEADGILRKCVHCGFCTATCPTYVLLGDELDSPRGRIYLIKNMLEDGADADSRTTRHIDRCLSCLSCMTTCPSGVDYMHLLDTARAHIEKTYRRPLFDRLLRDLLAFILPRPGMFRLALVGAWLARPLAGLMPGRLRAMLKLAPATLKSPSALDRAGVHRAEGDRRMRVALLTGCAQTVLAPEINEATIRLLNRHGCDVVIAQGAGCCGALTQHMGRSEQAAADIRANVAAWSREIDGEGLDAIVVNASGCGTTVKDYGHIMSQDTEWAARAADVAALAVDVSELLSRLELKLQPELVAGMRVAYHAACSLQHGQKVTLAPRRLLAEAGFEVREIPEGHLCCGSAGTYNLLQPELSDRLLARKAANIASVDAEVLAGGNIGCMVQLQRAVDLPVVHTVSLLDWATGGPKPDDLVP
jgi:glycolate oxidase iron-sulfur subunit